MLGQFSDFQVLSVPGPGQLLFCRSVNTNFTGITPKVFLVLQIAKAIGQTLPIQRTACTVRFGRARLIPIIRYITIGIIAVAVDQSEDEKEGCKYSY